VLPWQPPPTAMSLSHPAGIAALHDKAV
jgi:hypothetical protein